MNALGSEGRDFLFVTDYEARQCIVEPMEEVDPEEMLYDFRGQTNASGLQPACQAAPQWRVDVPSRETYHRSFSHVRAEILAGNSYLCNLTCRAEVETNLSLRDIFLRSRAPYRLWIKDKLVCFSPESFVRVEGGEISSYPMKGTIDATLPEAEERLMADTKEAAEHATIVDLIRNDISRVADHVRVERYRYVDRVRTHRGELLQTSSEIRGRLFPELSQRPGDVLMEQLPAGSITGAPKLKTCQIIAEAEDYQRGYYTGVMGLWRDGEIDSAVMIRFVDVEDGRMFFKAGGGITARSNEESEYREVIEKMYVPIF